MGQTGGANQPGWAQSSPGKIGGDKFDNGTNTDAYDRLSGVSGLDAFQGVLDVVGLTEPFGIVADLVNAGISYGRGDTLGGSLSLAGAVPIIGAAATVGKFGAKGIDTLKPGPFARESIPAHRGRPTAAEQKQVNGLMDKHGCHTCGTRNPGTKSGNAIADHQPAQALGEPEIFLPHCNHCKAVQGGQVLKELRRRAQE